MPNLRFWNLTSVYKQNRQFGFGFLQQSKVNDAEMINYKLIEVRTWDEKLKVIQVGLHSKPEKECKFHAKYRYFFKG